MRRVGRVNGILAVCVVASLTLAACTSKSKTTPSTFREQRLNVGKRGPVAAEPRVPRHSAPASSAPAAAVGDEDLNNKRDASQGRHPAPARRR